MKPEDKQHVEAAQGWLELGSLTEAMEELDEITPELRSHPDMLQIRCKIFLKAEKWDYAAEVANALCRLSPNHSFGPIHLAYALRELNRI